MHAESHHHIETKELSEKRFTHLHVHSEYSTLDGINKIKEYPKVCKEHGQTHVSITDHGNVAGSLAFVNSCRICNIKPIVGMEAYYSLGSRHIKAKDDMGRAYYHMILLARNNVGLHNLFKLSSYAYTEG